MHRQEKYYIGVRFFKSRTDSTTGCRHYYFDIYHIHEVSDGYGSGKPYIGSEKLMSITTQAHDQKPEEDTWKHDTLLTSYAPRIEDLKLSAHNDEAKAIKKVVTALIGTSTGKGIVKALRSLKLIRISYDSDLYYFIPYRHRHHPGLYLEAMQAGLKLAA